jgi:hypothetical protein
MSDIIHILYTPWGISLTAILACCCYYFFESGYKNYTLYVKIISFSLLAFVANRFLNGLFYRLSIFYVWDFTAWYLWGKEAAMGLNFYLPENSQAVFASLNLPASDYKEFMEAIVNVGFYYPPPTMFYFVGLGFLPFNSALLIWTLFILISLAACIYVTFRFCSKILNYNGLILIVTLFLLYPSVNATLKCSQTNFILLFFLILLEKYSRHKFAGILLALAFFTKPFMLIFGLFFLFARNWKAIVYFIATSAILSGLSILAFGFETFQSYFFNNATQRLPQWQFSEDINQSLNAVLIRANLISPDQPWTYTLLFVFVLALAFLYSIYLFKNNQHEIIWTLLLLVSLIIYPGTLSYYGVLLLFIVFKFFKTDSLLNLPYYLVIPLTGLVYFLNSVSVFSSFCLLIIVVLIKSYYNLKKMNSSELVIQN